MRESNGLCEKGFMRKRIILFVAVLFIAIAGIGGFHSQIARAQDPTIPTRTPTPDGSVAPIHTPTADASEGSIEDQATPPAITPSDGLASADPQPSALNLILPLAGLGLIGAGILLALLARGRNKRDDSGPQ
jgi:hypothetical protein